MILIFLYCNNCVSFSLDSVKDVRIEVDGEKPPQEKVLKSNRPILKWKSFPASANNSYRSGSRSKKWTRDIYSDILQIDGTPLPKLPEEEEAVGIITMEDVIEELLQVILAMFAGIFHDLSSMFSCTSC